MDEGIVDGPRDIKSVMTRVTGLPSETVGAIMEQVHANHDRLDGCPGHDFSPIGPARLGRKYRCIHCGGEIDSHAYYWHGVGMRDGRKS
jgi:predicted SprT family Zn-dependent metalloprotease